LQADAVLTGDREPTVDPAAQLLHELF